MSGLRGLSDIHIGRFSRLFEYYPFPSGVLLGMLLLGSAFGGSVATMSFF